MTGLEIKEERRARGWTQEQLARKVGCTQSMISMIEHGNRDSLYLIDQIEQVFRGGAPPNVISREPSIYLEMPRIHRPRLPLPLKITEWQRPEQSADFVHMEVVGNERVLLIVMDVAGHGISSLPAKVFLQGWLRGWLGSRNSAPRLDALITAMSEEMRRARIDGAGYFAIFSTEPTFKNGLVYEAVNCGLPTPFIIEGDEMSTRESARNAGTLPIAEREAPIALSIGTLFPPWRLVVATDGLLSRLGWREETKGIAFLRKWQSSPLRDLPPDKHIRPDEPVIDDELLAILQWNHWDLDEKWFEAEADVQSRLFEMVKRYCAGLDAKSRNGFMQCLDEAVANIWLHAYGMEPGIARLRFRIEQDAMRAELEDEGFGTVNDDMLRRSKGGLRLFDEYLDHASIRRSPSGGTIITMVINYPGEKPPAG